VKIQSVFSYFLKIYEMSFNLWDVRGNSDKIYHEIVILHLILSPKTCFHTFQKTLPVMVAVIEPLCGAFGESGLLVLPCIATHLIQVIYLFFEQLLLIFHSHANQKLLVDYRGLFSRKLHASQRQSQ
jgi:hypothetical protein